MVSSHKLPSLVAIGAAALLTAAGGLVAGFAARGAGSAEPPVSTEPSREAPGQVPGEGPPEAGDPGGTPPLRTLADTRGMKVGAAVDVEALADEDYRAVLGREFSTVTAENVMKWSTVEPARGVYNRSAADQLIAFARQHDQRVYGHTLVWHKQVPTWVTRESSTEDEDEDEVRALLRTHVEAEVSYFRDRVWAWDVVNEALNDDGTLRDTHWLRWLGPDYLADAFRWARAADPEVQLFLNDFGVEGINAKSNAMYDLVAQLLADGVPIDGVGFQVHWTLDPLPEGFADNLARFAALGLDVAITEMDVRMPEPATPQSLERQADIYAQAVDACLAVPRCVSFTVWGLTDAHSWVPESYPDAGAATLFDEDLRPKPAYAAVAGALEVP